MNASNLISMLESVSLLGKPVDASVVPKAVEQNAYDRVVCKTCGDIFPASVSKICVSCGSKL